MPEHSMNSVPHLEIVTIAPEIIDALSQLKYGLNAAESTHLIDSDAASDLFSDALDAIGKDYQWLCDLNP